LAAGFAAGFAVGLAAGFAAGVAADFVAGVPPTRNSVASRSLVRVDCQWPGSTRYFPGEYRAAAIARPLGSGSGDASFQRLEAADTVDALGRRKLIADLSLTQSLELLEGSCECAEFASALQALHLLCANIVARPEEALFRKVRLLNASFQQTVARYPGGVEALLALGFEESETLEGDEEAVCYVLEEPNLEEDIERCGRWYDGIKAHQAELLGRMEAHGVRALPVAAKGTGWAEGMTAPAPARPADNLTLHGQRGGGI
jgi:hypothetical protein